MIVGILDKYRNMGLVQRAKTTVNTDGTMFQVDKCTIAKTSTHFSKFI